MSFNDPTKHTFIEREAHLLGYRVSPNGEIVLRITGASVPLSSSKRGYKRFQVRERKKTCLLHRLQAYQKFGESLYEPGIEVRHLNNCGADNCIENIGIGTHSENLSDSAGTLGRKRKFDYSYVYDLYLKLGSVRGVASQLCMSCQAVSYIVKKVTASAN